MVVLAIALYSGTMADAGSPATGYTVAPGDNLWSIAITHYPPTVDPRVKIEEIRTYNDLHGSEIRPGTRLKLPPAY